MWRQEAEQFRSDVESLTRLKVLLVTEPTDKLPQATVAETNVCQVLRGEANAILAGRDVLAIDEPAIWRFDSWLDADEP